MTTIPVRRSRVVAVVLTALALVLALGACSGHKKPSKSTTTTTATPTASGFAAIEKGLLATKTSPPAIATATANIHLIGSDGATVALTAQVISVTLSGATTELHWRLISTNGSTVSANGNWASGGTSSNTDTSAIALIDTTGKERLLPYTNGGQAVFSEGNCVCSDTPRQVGSTAVDLYGTYPALSEGATTVSISIPGFPTMANVTVTPAK